MTQAEAQKALDRWLSIPIDYESIIPVLAELKYTPSYTEYVKKIADVEYRTVESIDSDVINYIANVRQSVEAERRAYEAKLDEMAGGDRIEAPSFDDALLNDVNPPFPDKRQEEDKRTQALESYMQRRGLSQNTSKQRDFHDDDDDYDDDNFDDDTPYGDRKRQNYFLTCRCPVCGGRLIARQKRYFSFASVLILAILFLFCTPIALLVLFFAIPKKELYHCKSCQRVFPMD